MPGQSAINKTPRSLVEDIWSTPYPEISKNNVSPETITEDSEINMFPFKQEFSVPRTVYNGNSPKILGDVIQRQALSGCPYEEKEEASVSTTHIFKDHKDSIKKSPEAAMYDYPHSSRCRDCYGVLEKH